MQNRRLSVERLEERRMLAIVIAGANYHPPGPGEEVGYVAPPQTNLAPIAMPNGMVPPGATELSPPAPGELPPGMTQLNGVAQTNAVTLAVGWMYNHQDAVGDVTETIGTSSYSVTLDVHDGADFFRYGVSEAADRIGASYVVRDGTHSEILSMRQMSTDPLIAESDPAALDGGLVYAQFDNDVLTAMAIHSEAGGVDTLWTYDVGQAFSLTPDGYAALNALVSAHVSGPAAAAALDTFHFAADQYFELAGVGPVVADFNHDQHIDATDYVVWRKNQGSAADFSLWRSHFDEAIAAGGAAAGGAAATAVPEPGSIALAAAAGGFALLATDPSRRKKDSTRTTSLDAEARRDVEFEI